MLIREVKFGIHLGFGVVTILPLVDAFRYQVGALDVAFNKTYASMASGQPGYVPFELYTLQANNTTIFDSCTRRPNLK